VGDVREALASARGADGPVVIHVETDRYAGVPSYGWWDVPVAEVSERESVRAARRDYDAATPARRAYLATTDRAAVR